MKQRDLYVAAYDLRDPKRLRQGLEILKGYSIGGQKSVFECFLTPAERNELVSRMAALVEPADDFLLLRLDPRSPIRTLGIAVAPQDPPFYYVG